MNVWEKAFREGLTPEPPLLMSDWADQFRVLTTEASAEAGKFRTDRTPYMREPMDKLSAQDPCQREVLMFASQTGKTEAAGLNWIGYAIHQAPGPFLAIQPSLEMADKLSSQRLEPMLLSTPEIKALVAPRMSRSSSNTKRSKQFPGGFLQLVGSNSPASLSSMPCRYVFADEIDRYPPSAGDEGDPVALAEKRATTFSRRKILLTSTPTIKDFSPIEREYLRSDQRKFFIPCPICGEFQVLMFKRLIFDREGGAPQYKCEKCGGSFAEHHKSTFLRRGEWRPTAEGDGKTAGYWLNGLNSPLGWLSWQDLQAEFEDAKGNDEKLQTFVNTRLAECWSLSMVPAVSADGLLSRCENYRPGNLPAGVLIVTMGVDVQADRLEVSTWGWAGPSGREEGWLIDHTVLMGDPYRAEPWQQLDAYIGHQWEHETGKKIAVSMVACDSGGMHTSEVYAFARERQARVMAIKGQASQYQHLVGRATKVDLNWRGQAIRNGARVFPVGVSKIKDTVIQGFLGNTEAGPGSLHFHAETGAEYFEQLTSERQLPKKGGGIEWTLRKGQRNETLDCLVYAYAALQRLYMQFDRRSIWEQFAKRLENPANGAKKSPVKLRARPVRDYVNNW